jgi:hypothetical protein
MVVLKLNVTGKKLKMKLFLLDLFLVYVKEFVIFYWENNKIDEKDNIVVIFTCICITIF